jgi:hypothetical protein
MHPGAADTLGPASGKEEYLRERVAQLEAELAVTQSRGTAMQHKGALLQVGKGLSEQNEGLRLDAMRRDLAQARARIEDLEQVRGWV